MLTFKRITMRNFFSFGNAPQTIDLDSSDITLVLGQNNDAVIEGNDSSGRRNGVGKSAIIQGIVFGLYGKSIANEIKIPNLVNKINGKNCEVKIEFEKDGISYIVERGRNPAFFNFIKLSDDQINDESRGEKKDTQEDLNEILGISQFLFEHIVVLNANVEPFLSMSAQKQRDMIEELLGITQLTEKAQLLKDMQKETKRLAEQERFKNETIQASNERIQKSIETLQEQANKFEIDKSNRISELEKQIETYSVLNFEELYEQANIKEESLIHNAKKSNLENRVSDLVLKYESYKRDIEHNKAILKINIERLQQVDIVSELKNHEELELWKQLESILKENITQKNYKEQKINLLKSTLQSSKSSLELEKNKLDVVLNSKCPLCKSSLEHNEHSSDIKSKILKTITDIENSILTIEYDISILYEEVDSIDVFDMPPKPETVYNTLTEAQMHEHKLQELIKQYEIDQINIFESELMSSYEELNSFELKDVPDALTKTEVRELELAYDSLKQQLQREFSTVNTYISQINTLQNESIVVVNYDSYNELDKLQNHQDFMVKLLLNKDSYLRKRIIEQNISFLNNRLQYYIDMCGSEHNVKFLTDLSVEIEKNDQYFDYKQLSRGERTRVNIALSCAFRDTYESLYQNINLICCDEALETGLDASGVLRAWMIFQDMASIRNKNVFVISHRDELISKTENIMKVTKEDGFSTVQYCTLDDIY